MKAINYHLLFVAVLACCLYVAGCDKQDTDKDKEEETDQPLAAINNGGTDLLWNEDGRFLTITTTASWTIDFSYDDNAPDWCSVTTPSGTGNRNVWVATSSNTGNEERRAAITVSASAQTMTITLTQAGKGGETPGDDPNTDPTPVEPVIQSLHLELPKVDDENWLLAYEPGDFIMEYDTAKRHPKWVAWPLNKSHIGSSGRTDYWQFDPRIPGECASVRADFYGYDRGHLCPSADRTASVAMNRQTFMYSNMSPQTGAFNQGIWATLEGKVRNWANVDTLYICAGGTIGKESDIMSYTDPSRMAVPKFYFKVILRKKASTGAFDAIGFWFENRSYSGTPLSSAQVKTIDEIETLTGLDFFYNLPKAEQDRVEAMFSPGNWL